MTGSATCLLGQPESSNVKDPQGKAAIATGTYDHLERFVTELEVLCRDRDMRGSTGASSD